MKKGDRAALPWTHKNMNKMKVVAIAISKKKGTRKTPVEHADLIQASRDQGLDVSFGDFAENIATSGIDWKGITIGTLIELGEGSLVEITQIGKECHNKCAIYYQAGDCIMPKEGVFARVLKGGRIRCNDNINISHHADRKE